MQIPRPPAVGDRGVIDELRSLVISDSLLGGASARPKGFVKAQLAWGMGWLGPLVSRRATDPLPPTVIYVAVTSAELRLYSKSLGAQPFEIGRWRRGSYHASLTQSGRKLRLEMELQQLGHVVLTRGPFFEKPARAVFEMVVQSAAAPAGAG